MATTKPAVPIHNQSTIPLKTPGKPYKIHGLLLLLRFVGRSHFGADSSAPPGCPGEHGRCGIKLPNTAKTRKRTGQRGRKNACRRSSRSGPASCTLKAFSNSEDIGNTIENLCFGPTGLQTFKCQKTRAAARLARSSPGYNSIGFQPFGRRADADFESIDGLLLHEMARRLQMRIRCGLSEADGTDGRDLVAGPFHIGNLRFEI